MNDGEIKNTAFRLSVIVPVYNVAAYLRPTLDSVLTAWRRLLVGDDSVLELLMVDDGSTDGSGALLDECAAAMSAESNGDKGVRPVVIHQANAGVSVARNRALELATGDWVMFMDADDLWEPNLLVELFSRLEDNPDVDAIGFAMDYVDEAGRVQGRLGEPNVERVMTGDELLAQVRGPYTMFIWSSCDKMYRRSAIERVGLRFPEGMKKGEDSLFVQKFFAYAGKLLLCPALVGYHYVRRGSSATHRRDTEPPIRDIRIFSELHRCWQDLRRPGILARSLQHAASLVALGKNPEWFEPQVRSASIEVLLDSREFNRVAVPFLLRYGGAKARIFAALYLVLPTFARRLLLRRF